MITQREKMTLIFDTTSCHSDTIMKCHPLVWSLLKSVLENRWCCKVQFCIVLSQFWQLLDEIEKQSIVKGKCEALHSSHSSANHPVATVLQLHTVPNLPFLSENSTFRKRISCNFGAKNLRYLKEEFFSKLNFWTKFRLLEKCGCIHTRHPCMCHPHYFAKPHTAT